MLVVGRVVDSRRQQRDSRRLHVRGQRAQRTQKFAWVLIDWTHSVAAEYARPGAADRLPAGQHVGHPGRHARVVFENHEAVPGADDVRSADRDIGVEGNVDPFHFRPVVGAPAHQILRDHAVAHDQPPAVDIGQEEVQSLNALNETPLDAFPFAGRYQPGHAIYREDALNGFVVAVDGEGDPLVQQRPVDPLLQAAEFVGGKFR